MRGKKRQNVSDLCRMCQNTVSYFFSPEKKLTNVESDPKKLYFVSLKGGEHDKFSKSCKFICLKLIKKYENMEIWKIVRLFNDLSKKCKLRLS